MKIQIKEATKTGDIRTRKGFAWLPVLISKDEKVWWEDFEIKEMFHQPMSYPGYQLFPYWALYDEKNKKVFELRVFQRDPRWVRDDNQPIIRPVPPTGSNGMREEGMTG